MSEQKALIFIPDISGFTKFVNETEIQHSQHIIEELIEVILQSNDMKMELSEIEGDAVLYYKQGDAPTPEVIAEQTKKMFLNFHSYIQQIERDTICQCGACRTASNLTLKFLLHYGEVGLSHIRDHTKLMGKAVILAHRIMKNDVDSDEYLLMTENYLSHQSDELVDKYFNWSVLKDGHNIYEHIGDVIYKYLELSPLRSELEASPPVSLAVKFPDPVEVSIYIDAPMSLIYGTIVDLNLRTEWSEGLKKITFDQEEIPRVGMKHVCDLPTGLVELETIQNSLIEGKIEYAERATKSILFPGATTYFILEDKDQGTNFRVEFHYKKLFLIGRIIDLIFRKKLKESFKKSSQNLKMFCETKMKKRK